MSEWRETNIKSISSRITSGGTPSTKIIEYYNGVIPWLNSKEIDFNSILATEKYITELGLSNSSAKWIVENSIIVAMYGATAGKSAITKIPLTTNQACCNITVDETKSDYRFIYYTLVNSYSELENMATGAAQQNLNARMIADFHILLPPLPEQCAIATVLSSLDDKIDLLHRQNNTLEAMAETLFQQWFLEEADEGRETEIGRLPLEIIDGDRGKNYPKNSDFITSGYCLFLSAQNVTNKGFDFSNCSFISREKDEILRSGKLLRNDIVLTTRGTVGNIAFYHDHIPYNNIRLNSGMVICRTISRELPALFLYILMRTNYFSQIISGNVSGSAQPQLPIRDIKNIKIIKPEKKLLDNFMKVVVSIYNKVFMNQSQIRTLEKLRDTLLPKLMSGEVRIEV